MNYLRARREKRKIFFTGACIVICIVFVVVFHASIGHIGRAVGNTISSPFVRLNSAIRNSFANTILRKTNTQKLVDEVTTLNQALRDTQQQMIEYTALQADYDALTHLPILKHSTISAIIVRPPVAGHDTLVLAVGSSDGINVGDTVFLDDHIAIGEIAEVYKNKSIVHMYSFAGTVTSTMIIDQTQQAVDLVGRGGGTFEIILPKNTDITSGVPVVLSDTKTIVVAITGSKISEDRDSFVKYLATTPFNIQNVRFVSVEKNNE